MLALIGGCALSAGAQTTQTWELRQGQGWVAVTPAAAPREVDPAVNRIAALLESGQSRAARKQGITWVKNAAKDAPGRDRVLWVIAQAFYQDDKRLDSFFYCDQLMDEHPDSPYFAPALQYQYRIADEFLSGHRRVFIYFPILAAEDEGVDMMYRVQQRSPGSPLAEKALLRTADFYYADSQFDLAADAYGIFAKSYPRSPFTPRAQLRRAYSNLAQFRGMKFDSTPLLDARAQLVELAATYPDLATQENLSTLVKRIDNTFANKLIVTGDFYQRTGQNRAAAYNYQYVLMHYPQAPEAAQAQKRLADLPAEARQADREDQ